MEGPGARHQFEGMVWGENTPSQIEENDWTESLDQADPVCYLCLCSCLGSASLRARMTLAKVLTPKITGLPALKLVMAEVSGSFEGAQDSQETQEQWLRSYMIVLPVQPDGHGRGGEFMLGELPAA